MGEKIIGEKLRLENNSIVQPMQYDAATGTATGFDISNPDGSKLHVQLPQYLRQSETSQSANKLRVQVYEDFKFLAENTPAATPMFESVARDYPKGVAFLKADKMGLWNETPGKNENTLDPKSHPAIITGNLRLPEGDSPMLTGGGGVVSDKKAQHFLGKDGKWHAHTHEEALLHELAHSVKTLQNMLSVAEVLEQNAKSGISIPMENVKINIRLENESRAIELVNRVLSAPLGRPEQEPSSYNMMRPFGVKVNLPKSYSPEELDKLKVVPVPLELKEFSQPKVVESQQHTKEDKVSLTPEQQSYFVAKELADLTPSHQDILKKDPVYSVLFDRQQELENLELQA
jgi:hypothetical protein